MEGKYCMSVGTQLNVFRASKLSVWLNYVKSPSTDKNMNHKKHVTPAEVSTSINLNIHNILLHGKKNYSVNWMTILFVQIFFCCAIILLIDCVVKFPCVQ
jgi:hypothetical protein